MKSETDILLLYPPWETKFYQAISLPELGGFLIKRGYKVKALDPVVMNYDFNETLDEIEKINPLIVGVSVPFTGIAKNALKLIKFIRKRFPKKIILVGGYWPSVKPEEFVDYCSLVVLNNGQETTAEIIECYKSGKDFFSLRGIAFRKDKDIVVNKREVEMRDKTIFPAWDLMPIERYNLTLYLSTGERAFPVQTGWGCPFSCYFCCNSKKENKTVEFRDIDNVIEEIKHINKNFGVHGIHIWDETFTLKKDRVIEFCEKIKKEKLDVRWSCQTRANLIDKNIVGIMKEAGCVRMSIGVESGNEQILKSINKTIDLDDAVKAIKTINDAGIVSYAGFMIGHPEDYVETVSNTVEFADKLNPSFIGFRNAVPYPGSVFRDIAEKEGGILTNDWSKYETEIVYVPPKLKNYNLKKVVNLAYTFFYWKNFERIKRIMEKNFVDMFEKTIDHGPEIYKFTKENKKVSFKQLMEKYCRIEDD